MKFPYWFRKNLVGLIVCAAFAGLVVFVIWASINAGKFPSWSGVVSKDKENLKTLWDWMELMLVPTTLTIGAYLLGRMQTVREESLANEDRRQNIFDEYVDKISDLVCEGQFDDDNSELVSSIARTKTLAALRQLDDSRIVHLMQFLQETGLINGVAPKISLNGVTFEGLNLSSAVFHKANFDGATFVKCNFEDANLENSSLIGCSWERCNMQNVVCANSNLFFARFNRSDLSGAIWEEAELNTVEILNTEVDENSLAKASVLVDVRLSNNKVLGVKA